MDQKQSKDLGSVELIYLPPNTTSKLQAIDQGVIRSLKERYRTLVVKKIIAAIDKEQPFPNRPGYR